MSMWKGSRTDGRTKRRLLQEHDSRNISASNKLLIKVFIQRALFRFITQECYYITLKEPKSKSIDLCQL